MSKRSVLRHADWLALVEPAGPFLTLPVLRRAWPDGLDRTARAGELRERVDALETDESSRREFVDWVLRRLLAFGPALVEGQAIPEMLLTTLPEHATVLRPDWAALDPTDGRARLLVALWPAGTDLTAHAAGERWAASPIDRMATHLRLVGVEVGLVTDGERFCLVWAPRTGPVGRATWVASVFAEPAERTLLHSFTSVLGAKRFFAVRPDDQLEALLAESASAQAEVTNQLGFQVRRAVELLVASFSRANRERGGALLAGLDPHFVYEAACTVLMRLVFLLSAEERRLLPLGDELYDRSYAVSTLRQSLRELADAIGNDETLEHSRTAWPRLLATFRAVHGGLAHDELRLPAYGGRLFDPDRYAFLEGRHAGESWRDVAGTPIPVDDRTMLGILEAVQILKMREAGVTEARRLSFRSLDVEQIGHVYEGLLDHSAQRVEEVTLGLVGKAGREPEVALSAVESHAGRVQDKLVAYLRELTGRSEKFLRDGLGKPLDDDLRRRLRAACDNDAAVLERVQPYGWLLRDDIRGLPMVVLPGYIHVTEVSHRRDTGTEYTTKELADEVARYALEPLVFTGPAEGLERKDWKLKSSVNILSLRVCDPAVGSGAIITAACRYLAERLVEAWAAERITPVIAAAEAGEDDVLIEARRAVAERCLFAADRDPMAVEMAKLSLWLITMAKDRPFSFLDHAFRAGDSLLGISRLEQVVRFHIDPSQAQSPLNFTGDLDPYVKEALEKRRLLEAAPVMDIRDAEEKARLLGEAERAMRTVNVLADLVVGAALSTATSSKSDQNSRLAGVSGRVTEALAKADTERDTALDALEAQAQAWMNEKRPPGAPLRRTLHWPLAFPEVFLEGHSGFDAMVGNPPFLGGKRISGPNGIDFREYLVSCIASGRKGNADLVAFFFLRASTLGQGIGFLATNSVSEGDTREVALDWMLGHGWTVTRAVKSEGWPGAAGVEIAKVWARVGQWEGGAVLNGRPVIKVNSSLDEGSRVEGPAYRLRSDKRSFIGSALNTEKFILSREEAKQLLDSDPRNAEVVVPFLNGDDLNSSPDALATRWVISFRDWPREQSETYWECFDILRERVEGEVRAKVEKARRAGSKSYAGWDDRWWQFWNVRAELYRTIEDMRRVMVMTIHSNTAQPAFVPTGQVFSHGLVVFSYDDDEHFGLLASAIHYWWAFTRGSSIRNAIRYTPTDCFETFPQPEPSETIGPAGAALEGYRRDLMLERAEGLTGIFTLVNNPAENAEDIVGMRKLHAALDLAVATAYGWSDLDLAHAFYETSQGTRYTVGPAARQEILDRLLGLNHERHAAEEASRGSAPKARGTGRRQKSGSSTLRAEVPTSGTLFGEDFYADAPAGDPS